MHDDLSIGAHLTTPRRGYVHHGIYAGNGRVIHYAGYCRLFRRGPVEEVPLDDFAGGHEVVVRRHAMPAFSGEVAVRRARSRLGEDDYHLLSNNCEHFAEWCVSGTSRSRQIKEWRARADAALAALGFAKLVSQARAEAAGSQ